MSLAANDENGPGANDNPMWWHTTDRNLVFSFCLVWFLSYIHALDPYFEDNVAIGLSFILVKLPTKFI